MPKQNMEHFTFRTINLLVAQSLHFDPGSIQDCPGGWLGGTMDVGGRGEREREREEKREEWSA